MFKTYIDQSLTLQLSSIHVSVDTHAQRTFNFHNKNFDFKPDIN